MTIKQQQFCKEYLLDLNATKAALRAGYSRKTAREQGNRLLTNADIQAEIQRLMKGRDERLKLQADEVVIELSKVGFANIADFYDKDMNLLPLDEIEGDNRAAIDILKIDKKITATGIAQTTTTLKLHNKVLALDSLLKHLGGYDHKNYQTPRPSLSPEM